MNNNVLQFPLVNFINETNSIVNYIINNYSVLVNIISLITLTFVIFYFINLVLFSKGGKVLDIAAKGSNIVIAAASAYTAYKVGGGSNSNNNNNNNNNNKDDDKDDNKDKNKETAKEADKNSNQTNKQNVVNKSS